MRIAIIGRGRLASLLAAPWAATGRHQIVFGAREAERSERSKLGEVKSVAEAAAFGDVVVFAVPWGAYPVALHDAGDLSGKTVVDCSSPFKPRDAAHPREDLAYGLSWSGAETVAAWAKGANVVLAFNGPGLEVLADPLFDGERATMFICGDDPRAKAQVSTLAEDLGFDVCDTGPLTMARFIEPMTMVWIDMARNQKRGAEFAFRLIRRGQGLLPSAGPPHD